MLLLSVVIALVPFGSVLLAMTSEEISKFPSQEKMKYEEEIRVLPNVLETIKKRELQETVSFQSRQVLVRESISKDGMVKLKRARKVISGIPGEGRKAVIVAEGFEGPWPPLGWTVIQTCTDSTHYIPAWWTQSDYDQHTGSYSARLWWSWEHQDEWLITHSIILTGSASCLYYASFWTYGWEGSVHGDHYYVKVSTDNGTTWDVLLDLSNLTGNGWNTWDYPYVMDLSSYAGDTIKLAWHGVDGPTNDGLWYIWLVDDVEVWYPSEHDIGVTTIYSPTGTYMPLVSVTPSVEVENFGANNEIFDVTFKIYDDTETEVYSETEENLTINQGETQTVNFPAFNTALGTYTTEAYTVLPPDEELSNDTLLSAFNVSLAVPEDTIHYDGPNNNDAIGLPTGGTYEAAIRITPTELAGYDGWQIKSVIFYHYEAATHSCAAKIYEGGTPTSPGALIIREPCSTSDTGWHRIDLANPVLLDTCKDIWVSVEVTHAAGEYPIGIDAGPAVAGKGDWINSTGTWEELLDYDLNYNFNVRALVEIAIQNHDIGVTTIYAPTGTYIEGVSVTPSVGVENFGGSNEIFDVTFKIYDDTETEVYSETEKNLTIYYEETQTVNFPAFNATVGTYTTEAYTELPTDEDLSDDTLRSAFNVSPALDVGITALYFSNNSVEWPPNYTTQYPRTDEEFIGAVISNNCDNTISDIIVQFLIDDVPIGEDTIGALLSHDAIVVDYLWTLPEPSTENKRVAVKTDPYDHILETNEDNNDSSETVSIYYVVTPHSNPPTGRAYDLRTDVYGEFNNWGWESSEFWDAFLTQISSLSLWDHAERVMLGFIGAPWAYVCGIRGHCYGMASSSTLYFEDPSLKPVQKPTFAMEKEEAKYEISNYQQKMFLDVLRFMLSPASDPATEYTKLLSKIRHDKLPTMILSQKYATSAYKILERGDFKIVYVYDNAYYYGPGETKTIWPRICIFDFRNDTNDFWSYGRECLDYEMYQNDTNMYCYGFPYRNYSDASKGDVLVQYPRREIGYWSKNLLRGVYSAFRELLIMSAKFMVTIACPVDGLITDQHGRKIGFSGDSLVNEIPDASVDTALDVEIYYLPDNLEYTVQTTAYDTGMMMLNIVIPVESDIVRHVQFDSVQLEQNTKTEISFTHSSTNFPMEVDIDGNGTPDTTLYPSYNGTDLLTGIELSPDEEIIPDSYDLCPLYPNPSSSTIQIRYALPKVQDVTIEIYDITGRTIETIVNGYHEAGYHLAVWEGKDKTGKRLTPGVYFCRMKTPDFVATRKVILMQ